VKKKNIVLTYPWEDCDEVRDEKGIVYWVPKPYALEPEYIDELEKQMINTV
jgi:hypothetical protein